MFVPIRIATRRVALMVWLTTFLCISVRQSAAQQRYELVTKDGKNKSVCVRTAETLSITSELGGTTEYQRKRQFDSTDGAWLGYYSSSVQQVVRWPASGKGNLQVGKLIGSRPSYRQSLMRIAASDTTPNDIEAPTRANMPRTGMTGETRSAEVTSSARFRFTDLPKVTPKRLDSIKGLTDYRVEPEAVSFLEKRVQRQAGGGTKTLRLAALSDDTHSGSLLGLNENAGGLRTVAGNQGAQDWTFSDMGNGLYRIQSRKGRRTQALAATRTRGVGLALPAADARQLWRPIVHPRRGYVFAFESVYYPGYCLTHTGGGIYLNPFSFAPGQFWLPVNPIAPLTIQPLLRNFHTEITPNPPLPPVKVRLTNSQPRPIEVLLGDATNPPHAQRIKILAGGEEVVTIQRDAGSMVMEYSEVLTWSGSWQTQTFTTEIPPRELYDISVYEVRLQSIAIDRTGKSPNVIEDVNYQPRSIGWFGIPGGEAVHDGQKLDVFTLAQRAQNPGAVRRFSIEELENYTAPESVPAIDPGQSIQRRKF